jgi:hypothetical protein
MAGQMAKAVPAMQKQSDPNSPLAQLMEAGVNLGG